MAYDPNLDETLYEETVTLGTTRLKVSVHSYNGGTPKLQISRENQNQNEEWRYSKLGRMTKDEVEAVHPLMQEALEVM